MRYEPVDLGFATADGEDVGIAFDEDALTLTFTDWRERPITAVFREVLAFQWGHHVSNGVPREDQAYEVIDSPDLVSELRLNGISDAKDYTHYKLCFNACGILDVLCRRA